MVFDLIFTQRILVVCELTIDNMLALVINSLLVVAVCATAVLAAKEHHRGKRTVHGHETVFAWC